jgi:hypothetical protein
MTAILISKAIFEIKTEAENPDHESKSGAIAKKKPTNVFKKMGRGRYFDSKTQPKIIRGDRCAITIWPGYSLAPQVCLSFSIFSF